MERPLNRTLIERALAVDRQRAQRQHGPGAWDVADVMAIIEPLLPEVQKRVPQHIDLQKERDLTNTVNWTISLVAWAMTCRWIVTRDRGWGIAALFTWAFGTLLARYEDSLDQDLAEQDAKP